MRFFPLLCALLVFGSLTACGVKPHDVDKPEGKEDLVFPRTYPAPNTHSLPQEDMK